VLNVTTADYVAESTIEDFEALTGIKVNYDVTIRTRFSDQAPDGARYDVVPADTARISRSGRSAARSTGRSSRIYNRTAVLQM
jgi:hypothetical protein